MSLNCANLFCCGAIVDKNRTVIVVSRQIKISLLCGECCLCRQNCAKSFVPWVDKINATIVVSANKTCCVCVRLWLFFVSLYSCFVAILEKREEVKICYDFEKRLSLEILLQFGQEGGASLSLSLSIFFFSEGCEREGCKRLTMSLIVFFFPNSYLDMSNSNYFCFFIAILEMRKEVEFCCDLKKRLFLEILFNLEKW